jgi:Fe-S cluster assembly protein SufD
VSAALDLPTRRNEAWKYSDLRAAVGEAPPLAPEPSNAPPSTEAFSALKTIELTFENGRVVHWPENATSAGPRVHSKDAPDAPRAVDAIPVGAIAARMRPDAWMPIVEAGVEDVPVLLRVVGTAPAGSAHMRVGVIVPAGLRLTIVELHEGAGNAFSNLLVEAFVADGGELNRIVVQSTGDAAVVVSTGQVFLEERATLRQFILAEGGKLARIETHVSVEGEGASVELNGVYLAGAGRHADLTSVITHHAPNSETRQLIKGVARKGGRGVFQGKIVVERAAQKTDARQYHHGMLLEAGAEVLAKPELMIHADDVQCAHGNTAGGLGERALFYMRSRGVPEAEARAMLIEGFLVEAIPAGLPEALRDELTDRIRTWLGAPL